MSALTHHWGVLRDAWTAEKARTAGRLRSAEPDFLPAALQVIESPVSPTGRVTAWVLLAGLLATIFWTVLGRVDIVASAQGRLLPADDVKLVQAADTGVVRRIYVHDGDVVRRGQPLVDLDPTVSSAEEAQAQKALAAAELDVARNRAIADALRGGGVHFVAPPGTPADVALTQSRLVLAQVAENRAAVAGLASAQVGAMADARAANEQIRKYDATVPVLDREVEAMNGLAAKGYAPGLRLMELQRQRHSEAAERAVAGAQRSRGLADADRMGHQLAQSREQAMQQALSDLSKAQNDAILRREELTKARQKSRLQRIVAPADGTVQQLAIHTVGGVVEPVKPLMVLVPEGALTMEAKVMNKDAGFVRRGQSVQVKIEAFAFTRYGSVPGRIVSISRDAVQDKDVGPYYVARIALAKASIGTENGQTALSPGLAATADIGIGSRRIISFLIGPMSEVAHDAGRER